MSGLNSPTNDSSPIVSLAFIEAYTILVRFCLLANFNCIVYVLSLPTSDIVIKHNHRPYLSVMTYLIPKGLRQIPSTCTKNPA
jgi:hypothetical protein